MISACCPHTRRGHYRDGQCKFCDCREWADQPATPVRRSFDALPDAYTYAAGAARVQGKKWFACLRNGRWYAIPPGLTGAVRNNPNWPGVRVGQR